MWVGSGAVLNEVAEDTLVVVADDEDLTNLGHPGDGSEAVLNNWVARDFEERLHELVSDPDEKL